MVDLKPGSIVPPLSVRPGRQAGRQTLYQLSYVVLAESAINLYIPTNHKITSSIKEMQHWCGLLLLFQNIVIPNMVIALIPNIITAVLYYVLVIVYDMGTEYVKASVYRIKFTCESNFSI